MDEFDQLPLPVDILPNTDILGSHHIVPIAHLGYKEGYDRMVQDVYTSAYHMSLLKWVWIWDRRIVVHTRPLHLDIYGREQHCVECAKYPDRPDDEIIMRSGR